MTKDKTKRRSSFIALLYGRARGRQLESPLEAVDEAKPTTVAELASLLNCKLLIDTDRSTLSMNKEVVLEGHIEFDFRKELVATLVTRLKNEWPNAIIAAEHELIIYNYVPPSTPINIARGQRSTERFEYDKTRPVTKIAVRRNMKLTITIEDE